MTIRFDLPESLDEFDEQENVPEQPCFPYPGFDDRHGTIDFWPSIAELHLIRLHLKGIDTDKKRTPLVMRLRSEGRKVLLKVVY